MGGDLNFDWNRAAASTLDWWVDAGVDALVEDDVRDWLSRLPRPAATPAEHAPAAEILPDDLEAFVAWRLGADAPETGWHSPMLAPLGGAGAPLMVLLDMPEASDGETGTLLSGPEGRLLDRMLAAIGHSRTGVFLATIAVARPLSGTSARDVEPRLFELARHLVDLVRPNQLLLLGNLAQRAFDGAELGRFAAVNQDDGMIDVLASLHPRMLLERPARKAEAWKHLQLLIGGNEQ
jgi:DNA polymerase